MKLNLLNERIENSKSIRFRIANPKEQWLGRSVDPKGR